MAAYLNRMMLIGNLGADPEIRVAPNGGGTIANLTVATKETWRDKTTGEQKESTEWHKVAVFGRNAEYLRDYAKKGAQVFVEGKLRTRKWKDQSGQDRYTTEIVVNAAHGTVDLLGNRGQSQQQTPSQPQQPAYDPDEYSGWGEPANGGNPF